MRIPRRFRTISTAARNPHKFIWREAPLPGRRRLSGRPDGTAPRRAARRAAGQGGRAPRGAGAGPHGRPAAMHPIRPSARAGAAPSSRGIGLQRTRVLYPKYGICLKYFTPKLWECFMPKTWVNARVIDWWAPLTPNTSRITSGGGGGGLCAPAPSGAAGVRQGRAGEVLPRPAHRAPARSFAR